MKLASKRGPVARSRLTCRMFVGLLLAVLLAFGPIGRVPVARASAQTLCIMAPPWQVKSSYTSTSGYIRTWAGWAGYDCGYGPYYTYIAPGFSWTLDGVTNPAGCTFGPAVGTAYPTESTFYIGGFEIRTTGSTYSSKFTDGQYHVVTWSSGTQTSASGAASFAAGSWISKWNPGSVPNYISQATWGAVYATPSVAITGASSVAINVTSSYTATITGGAGPFTGHWTLTGVQTALGPTAAVVGTTSVLPWTFGSKIGLQNIRYDVTDSTGASAYALIDVLVGSYAPQLKGQLYFAGDELRFCLYPQASNPLGEYVEPGTENVMNTDDYTIDRVMLGTEWAYYRLADVAPLANPYIVHVSYVDPTNGRVYPYTFTFDTTSMAGGGDWGQGDGSHGGGELPSWLQALRDIMKEGLQALFVPTDAQIALLVPGGSLGASLMEGTSWGSGSSTWNMHVHWGTNTITLVNMDFATVSNYGFVRAIRYAIQAGISLGLVYMIVVLI